MQTLVYGATEDGQSVGTILFSNVLWGKLLKTVAIIPRIPWYTLSLYALSFVSLAAFTAMFLQRCHEKAMTALVIIFDVFLAYECFITPGYVITTAVMTVVTVAFFGIYAEKEQKNSPVWFILSILYSILASLLSYKVYLAALLITSLGVICYFLWNQKLKKAWKWFLLALVCSVCVSTALFVVDRVYYQKSEHLQMANEYRDAYESIYSFGYADYEDVAGKIEIASDYEYTCLTNGFMTSYNTEDIEKLKVVGTTCKAISKHSLFSFFKTITKALLNQEWFYFWVSLCLFGGIFLKKGRKKTLLSALGILCLSLFTLYMLNAVSYHWIYAAVFVAIGIPQLLSYKETENGNLKEVLVYTAALLVILYNAFSDELTESVSEVKVDAMIQSEDVGGTTPIDLIQTIEGSSAFDRYSDPVFSRAGLVIDNSVFMLLDNTDYNIGYVDAGGRVRRFTDPIIEITSDESNMAYISVTNVSDTYTSFSAAVWSAEDQSDLEWIPLTETDDGYFELVDLSNYPNLQTVYIHVYGTRADGTALFLDGTAIVNDMGY